MPAGLQSILVAKEAVANGSAYQFAAPLILHANGLLTSHVCAEYAASGRLGAVARDKMKRERKVRLLHPIAVR